MKWNKVLIITVILLCYSDVWAQECTVSSTAVNFGDYNTYSGSSLDTTGSISVSCSPPTATTVKLDVGQNSSGSFNPRRMSDGSGNYLNYGLYTDASHIIVWGDGTGGSSMQPGGSNVVVYGRIPALQKVKPGSYNDSVMITVEW